MSSKMTFGDLFAGIGGLSLGLERAGMVCKWQVEIDDFCQKVLAKHWPNVERFEDVRNCGKHNLASVDLICGGFPCQDVSIAGKRKGLQDEQSGLWTEFARIISELKPRWVLVENVPGLLSSNAGWDFGTVLRDLAQSGYDAEWDCIPAAAFGAPHLRYRVFIVAYTTRARLERSVQPKIFFTQCSEDMANAKSTGETATQQQGQVREFEQGSEDVAYCQCQGCQEQDKSGLLRCTQPDGRRIFSRSSIKANEWWAVESDVGRMANGIPHRVDRLRALGNAVVPQVAEWLGRRIIEAEELYFVQ